MTRFTSVCFVLFSLLLNFYLGIKFLNLVKTQSATRTAGIGEVQVISPDSGKHYIQSLSERELGEIVTKLRTLGFSEELVRAGVRSYIESARMDITKVFLNQAKVNPHAILGPELFESNLTRSQLSQLASMQQKEQEALLGIFGKEGLIDWRDSEQFSFLAPEKADATAAICKFYALAGRKAGDDQRLIDKLSSERDAELRKLLTDREYTDYERRRSPTAQSLADCFKYINLEENSVAHLFTLRKAFDEENRALEAPPFEKNKAFADVLKRSLSQSDFVEWQRSLQGEYRALIEIDRRFRLSPDVFSTLKTLPEEISQDARRVLEDRAKTPDEQRASLRQLADSAKSKILKQLGNKLGSTYIEATDALWLKHLEDGSAYYYNEDGGRALQRVRRNPNDLRR